MIENKLSQYIRSISLGKPDKSLIDNYPFNLSAIKNLDNMDLHPYVTFIVGENGSGKSTLLESIAVAYGFNAEGGSKNFNFSTKDTHSTLHNYLKLIKGVKMPKDNFFLRAESFYNVSSNVDELNGTGSPTLYESYGGKSLHKQSHGESFISLVSSRFRGSGLYILDEPEAALSPSRQMALISLIHDLVKDDSQFIIATHSPILMAYPNAIIYNIDNGYTKTEYMDTEHYQITKEFLNTPERMLDILLD